MLCMTYESALTCFRLVGFSFSRQMKDPSQTSFSCSPSIFSILDPATDFLSYWKQRCHEGCVQRQVANRAGTSGLQIPHKCNHKYVLNLKASKNDN